MANFFSADYWKALYFKAIGGQETAVDPNAMRGTFAGLGHSRTIEHLVRLGVTAIELLPVQETGNDQNDRDPTSANGDNSSPSTAAAGVAAPNNTAASPHCRRPRRALVWRAPLMPAPDPTPELYDERRRSQRD